jgi:hypothetical protein
MVCDGMVFISCYVADPCGSVDLLAMHNLIWGLVPSSNKVASQDSLTCMHVGHLPKLRRIPAIHALLPKEHLAQADMLPYCCCFPASSEVCISSTLCERESKQSKINAV